MLRIFFIRHGQTDYNLKGIVQGGGVDSDLNTTGIKQANLFWDQYKDTKFQGLACSGLKRTYQTISPFFDSYEAPIRLPEFNELNWGIMEGKKATEEMRKEYLRINQEWESGNLNAKIEGGESPFEAWERLREGVDKVSRFYKDGNILVCVHGRILRILLSEMLGYGMRHMNHFPHDNTGLNLIVLNPSGKVHAERINDLSHLE